MSIETWKKKYYKDVDGAKKWTDLECANHTLKKYKGISKLEDHDLSLDDCDLLRDDGKIIFSFNGDSCSFCKKYYQLGKQSKACAKCPLYKEGNGCGENEDDAYSVFCEKGNTKPMIALMKKIISKCDENGKYIKK